MVLLKEVCFLKQKYLTITVGANGPLVLKSGSTVTFSSTPSLIPYGNKDFRIPTRTIWSFFTDLGISTKWAN